MSVKEWLLLTFGSATRTFRAESVLQNANLKPGLVQLPPKTLDNCGYGLRLPKEQIENARDALAAGEVEIRGTWEVEQGEYVPYTGDD